MKINYASYSKQLFFKKFFYFFVYGFEGEYLIFIFFFFLFADLRELANPIKPTPPRSES